MAINLLFISIAPSITFLIWIYFKDKYEKEPIKFLTKLFSMGALISIPAIVLEDILFTINIENEYLRKMYISFIVAAFSEEILKAIVLFIFTIKNKNYTEKLDGIVYSIFISLGFATIENIIYVTNGSGVEILEIGISRGLISVPAHLMFAITMGYYLSIYKFSNKHKIKSLVKLIVYPILLHGFFDFIIILNNKVNLIIFIIYLIYLWKINLDKLDEYTYYARKKAYRIKMLKLNLKLKRKK
ncbi:MAG: PrsW family intramembrane metalloprotease [Paraclostridium sp.]